MRKLSWAISLSAVLVMLAGCGKGQIDDQDEVAQAAGDVMSSFDESSGDAGGGAFAAYRFPRLENEGVCLADAWGWLVPEAQAVTYCRAQGFSGCASKTRVRNFGGCSMLGAVTMTGKVTLTFTDAGCLMPVGASVTRTPEFTVTGRKGATLTVSAPGGGQTVTRTGTESFTYRVGGLNRSAKDAAGAELFNIDTTTTSDIGVTGRSRLNRVMDGGQLVIQHPLKNYTVKLTPEKLTWDGTCNCAVSGKLSGTVEGEQSADSIVIEVTGCGTAKVTANDKTDEVTLDRCAPVS